MKQILLVLSIVLLITGCGKQAKPVHPLSYDKSKDVKPMLNGKLHGVSKFYLGNGTLVSTLEYKNGKRNGEYKRYDRYSNLWYIGIYKDDKLYGIEKSYDYRKKKLLSYDTIMYKNDKKNGLSKHYNSSDQLLSVKNYINNELDGEATFYHANGKLRGKENYKNGAPQGTTTFYYDNEKVEFIYKYDSNGEQHGIQKRWYADGDLLSQVTYRHGVKHGPYIEHSYAFNEHVVYKGNFVDDVEKPIVTASQKKDDEKRQQRKKVKSSYVSLNCSFGSSTSRSQSIAKGKGEGSALGYMMKNANARPDSSSEARNYCTTTANIQGMNCDDANTYLSACIRKFGY